MRNGRRGDPNIKEVDSVEELESLYDRLSKGGSPSEWPDYPGKVVKLPDGTKIGIRYDPETGIPTIDVKLPDGTYRKVHIK